MTLHTRVIVTSPDVPMLAAFDRMRELIGATDEHRWGATSTSMDMSRGQGLPALMWVNHLDGKPESHDEYCEPDCSGMYHDPAGWLMIHFDTGYAYTAANGASCSDLHAWLVQEIGAWLTAQGATWQWYDESGDGWAHGEGWGTLGDPAVGALGSTVQRRGPDDAKRAFGDLALAAILAGAVGGERL